MYWGTAKRPESPSGMRMRGEEEVRVMGRSRGQTGEVSKEIGNHKGSGPQPFLVPGTGFMGDKFSSDGGVSAGRWRGMVSG